MDKSRIERLIASCAPDEKTRLTTLYNGSVKALRAYQEASTASALRDWEAAEAALEKAAAEAEGRGAAGGAPAYRNRIEALAALQAEGWKVKKSKIYKDCKDGLLVVQADGTVRQSDLHSYVYRAGLEKAVAVGGEIERDQAEKVRLENKKLKAQIEKLVWERERDQKKYLLKEAVRTEQALKVAVVESRLKHFGRARAAEIIAAVGGDTGKARVFISLYEAVVDEACDEMGRMDEIEVVVGTAEKGGAAGTGGVDDDDGEEDSGR